MLVFSPLLRILMIERLSTSIVIKHLCSVVNIVYYLSRLISERELNIDISV